MHNSLTADHDEDIGNCDDDDDDDDGNAAKTSSTCSHLNDKKYFFPKPPSFRLVLSRQKTRS